MKYLVFACVAATVLTACQKKDETPPPADSQATATPSAPPASTPEPAQGTAPAAGASVQLAATKGHQVTGSLSIAPMGDGVHFTGSLQGLPPNAEFGFHVHEKGDCSAPDGSSAGGHFNPTSAEHGNPTSGTHHHAGDMLNIKSNGEGVAQVDTTAAGTTLHGNPPTDIMGKAIVVHEGPDDYTTQPSGNSGKRVACGVIGAPSSP